MAGSLRENLDPFSEHDDAALNDALRSAGFYALSTSSAASTTEPASHSVSEDAVSVTSGERATSSKVTLDTQVEAGGANFSLGQRYTLSSDREIILFI